jgi:DNA-binding IclR family transcriptional regulator
MEPGEKNVRSINRAIRILKCFNLNERKFTLTEISKKVGLPKSTASRLLLTLESEGFISKNIKTNYYQLGNAVYYLGIIAKENIDLRRISNPIMEDICRVTKETVNLYLLENNEKICFNQVESPLAIKRYVKIGDLSPIWYGATGKVILSYLDKNIWHVNEKELKKYTEKTIIDPQEFIKELIKIRNKGYAISVGEKESDVGCVAAPIFNEDRMVIGCISVSGPTYRFPKDTDYFVSLIVDGAGKISKELGYFEKTVKYRE